MDIGIFAGVSNDAYHGGPGDSKSDLDRVRRSLLHYKTNKDAANDNEPTTAQFIGSAFHSCLLEPEDFAARYVVAPKFDRRTKDGKAGWEAFQSENAGKLLLDQCQNDQLFDMAEAVHNHEAAHALLTGASGQAELSAFWNDLETGLFLRCRPDFLRDDGIVVDVKTTDDASLEEFSRSIVKWRYHVQAAFYLDGLAVAIKQSGSDRVVPDQFVFLVVEKKPPYAVACYVLDEEAIALGREEYREDVLRLAGAKALNMFPGYGNKIQKISVPVWYAARSREARA